jgi:hypothetical protein
MNSFVWQLKLAFESVLLIGLETCPSEAIVAMSDIGRYLEALRLKILTFIQSILYWNKQTSP